VAPKLQDGDLPDPYRIRVGLKTDDELSQLRRRRKTGKRLEIFHRKQNDVSFSLISYHYDIVLKANDQLIQSMLKPMEEHTQEAREDEAHFRFSVRKCCGAANLC